METVSDSTAEQLEALRAENAQLRQKLQSVQHSLKWLQNQLFGQKSEKRRIEENPQQQTLLDLLGDVPVAHDAPQPKQRITYERGRTKKNALDGAVNDTGLRFDASVPVETIEVAAPELSGPDADQYEIIDEKVTYRLAQRPGSYVVLAYRRPVLKHKASAALSAPSAPAAVFDRSYADVSLLAGMLVDKFVFHLPLYRQHQRLEQAGIVLSRGALSDWVKRSIALLAPIHDAQLRHILQSRTLAMDETPIKAGRRSRGKMRQAWYWPIYGDDDEIAFTYSATRARQHLLDHLQGFSGTLLTDGYAAYEQYAKKNAGITRAQCWAHSRRCFVKAEKMEPEAAAVALEFIRTLYRIEERIDEHPLDDRARQAVRVSESGPIVDAFFQWCNEQRQRHDLVNSNPLAKALKYVLEREAALRVFINDPTVALDTNHLERALRVIPMGRKNWNFCWTEIGARQVGIIQSLLTTCRLQAVDPYAYLVDVLQRVSQLPAREVEQLTPLCWKTRFAANPLCSDLDHAR